MLFGVQAQSLTSASVTSGSRHPDTRCCGCLQFPRQTQLHLDKSTDSWAELSLTLQQAYDLELRTRGQIDNPEWFKARHHRLTASVFGKIMTRKKALTPQFVKAIFDPKPFRSEATDHGITNDSKAKQKFLLQNPQAHFHDIGLVVNPSFPFIGASPDAKICLLGETGIAEVKCPFKHRNETIREACADHEFCLEPDNDGQYRLKDTHPHWFQVQGQLLVTGAPFCMFIVHTNP